MKALSQSEQAAESIRPAKITIGLRELSPKEQKVFLGVVKELGFAPGEIEEVTIRIIEEDEEGTR